MATRIEKILERARDTLADPNGERWSQARLLRLLDEGQKDVVKHTRILKGETDIPLVPNQSVYALPKNVWLITRAAFNGCKIALKSHGDMDEYVRVQAVENRSRAERYTTTTSPYSDFGEGSYCWEMDTGSEIEAVIYDRRNLENIKVYPTPSDDIATNSYLFETPEPEFEGAELLGVTTDITNYSFSSPYGVVTNFYDPQVEIENFVSDFGVLTGVNESEGIIHLWYIAMSNDLETVDDALQIPEMFDTALKHYVVANAFDDDYDTRFAEKAAKALAYYERELGIVKETDTLDGTRTSDQYRTPYNGAFS